MSQIFRQEAIDRMASPDRLDRPLELVKSKHWLVLACFSGLLLLGLIWSLFVSLPIKATGSGILINPAGLNEITIAYEGRVNEVLVQPGDQVEAGSVIATMTRSIKQHDIDIALAALEAARESADNARHAFTQSQARYQQVDRQRAMAISTRKSDLRRQLQTREKLANDLRVLVDKGAVTPLELVNVVTTIDTLEENLRQLEQERLEIEVAKADRLENRDKQLLVETQEIRKRELELQRLQAETDDAIEIKTFQTGRIAEIKVNPGDVLPAGTALALLNPNPDQQRLQAVLFLPAGSGKKVRQGMAVEISPGTAEKEIYGHIKATVLSASPLPASSEGMRRLLQNDRLVEELSRSGAPIQVLVELRPSDNPSGFQWSSSSGPDYPITAGTLLQAMVVVERRAVIDVLLPGIRQRVQYAVSGGS